MSNAPRHFIVARYGVEGLDRRRRRCCKRDISRASSPVAVNKYRLGYFQVSTPGVGLQFNKPRLGRSQRFGDRHSRRRHESSSPNCRHRDYRRRGTLPPISSKTPSVTPPHGRRFFRRRQRNSSRASAVSTLLLRRVFGAA